MFETVKEVTKQCFLQIYENKNIDLFCLGSVTLNVSLMFIGVLSRQSSLQVGLVLEKIGMFLELFTILLASLLSHTPF